MPEIIRYEDIFDKPVNAEVAPSLEHYYKVFMTGDVVKKKEYYIRNLLQSVIYYKDSHETESEAVATVLSGYSGQFFEIWEREAWGAFIIERSEAYDRAGNKEHYRVTELYDADGQLICEKTEELVDGMTQTEVRKYCFDTTGNRKLECFYDKDGALRALSGKDSPFVPENDHTVSAAEFPMYFPDFITRHPYYATADFLPDRNTL